MNDSKKYKLNKKDMMKVGKGGLIAMGGCLLAWAIDMIPMIDFGDYQLLAQIVGMMLVNLSQKYYQGKESVI